MAVGVQSRDYFRKWVRCENCGFHYSVYSRPPALIHQLYSPAYREKNAAWRTESPQETFRKIIALPLEQSETKQRVAWIKKNIAELRTAGIVRENEHLPCNFLDIGGGSGIFAYEFQDKAWRGHIIDPSSDSGFIRDQLQIPLVRDFYRPNVFPVIFTLLSAIYVLEHIADPLTFLESVRADLTPDSLLFLEVPDVHNFTQKPAEDDIFHSCHLWMFDRVSLSRALEKVGMRLYCGERLNTIRGHYAYRALAGLIE